MLLGRVDFGVRELLLILHILAVIVAFAPAVVHPLMGNRLRGDGGAARNFSLAASIATRTVYLPALVLVGVLGFGLVAVSDGGGYAFSDPWVSAAILLWLIIAAVVGAVILPAERLLGQGDAGAESKLRAGGGAVSLLLVVVLFLMVVKPG